MSSTETRSRMGLTRTGSTVVRVHNETHRTVRQLADLEGITAAEVLRRAINHYVAR